MADEGPVEAVDWPLACLSCVLATSCSFDLKFFEHGTAQPPPISNVIHLPFSTISTATVAKMPTTNSEITSVGVPPAIVGVPDSATETDNYVGACVCE